MFGRGLSFVETLCAVIIANGLVACAFILGLSLKQHQDNHINTRELMPPEFACEGTWDCMERSQNIEDRRGISIHKGDKWK